MSKPSQDTALRYIETLRLLPVGQWVTAGEVHRKIRRKGHAVSKRTIERDLIKLAKPFAIEVKKGDVYQWRRTKAIEG